MKNYFVFILFVLIIIGALYLLSGGDYSLVPADKDHAGITDYEVCMECHPMESAGSNAAGGPGKEISMTQSHPPKFECFKCHMTEKK